MVNWFRRLFRRKKEKKFSSKEQQLINDINQEMVREHKDFEKYKEDEDAQKRTLKRMIVDRKHDVASMRIKNKDLRLDNLVLKREETEMQGRQIAVAQPICEICMAPFADTETQSPRLLVCGHSLCISCANNSLKIDHNGFYIPCPYCRTKTEVDELGPGSIPKNYSLMQCARDVAEFCGDHNQNNMMITVFP